MSKAEIQLKGTSSNSEVFAGIVTGQIAGLVMAIVVMLVFILFLNKGPHFPVQVIGSLIIGESALSGFHLSAFLIGLVLHQLGPSLLWGIVYGLLAQKLAINDNRKSVTLGIAVGVISMSGPYVLIPFLMKTIQGTDYWNQQVPIMWDWAAHIIFGASFVLFPIIKNRLFKDN
tara:strand:- start:2609 stop:3127 length:519 start_codon:yes stop_codon:yes gene_type:complete